MIEQIIKLILFINSCEQLLLITTLVAKYQLGHNLITILFIKCLNFIFLYLKIIHQFTSL